MKQRGRPRKASSEPTTPTREQPTVHSNLPIIEVTEAWLLDTLMNDTTAGRMIVARLDPCTALILPGQFDQLITRLRKLGHTPRILDR
jgi:hypothetical protein